MIVECEKCEELENCEVFWTTKENLWLCSECKRKNFPDAILWDKLIGAASDLLEVCELAVECMRGDERDSEFVPILEKAIAKAKGESK